MKIFFCDEPLLKDESFQDFDTGQPDREDVQATEPVSFQDLYELDCENLPNALLSMNS